MKHANNSAIIAPSNLMRYDMPVERLQLLMEEHSRISELMRLEKEKSIPDEISMHRMKKQQQLLQNQIDEVRSRLHPDIIA